MSLDICKHLWCQHHRQRNGTYPTLPKVSCVPLFQLFVCFCGKNTIRSTLNKFWNAKYHIQYRLCYIKYLRTGRPDNVFFQILLQLIRGSSFNSWVRNEILPNVKKKKKPFHPDFKICLFIYFWQCWVFVLCRVFSSFREQGLLSRASHCDGWVLLLLSMGSRARGLQ